jgi:hypothetical protein
MLWLVAAVGCQQDLLLAMGDLTGVADAAARRAAPPEEPEFELPAEQPEIVAVPLEGSGPGVGGDAREREAATAAARREFDPISVPQGPMEGTGVSFEGVSTGSSPASMRGPGAINEFRRRR